MSNLIRCEHCKSLYNEVNDIYNGYCSLKCFDLYMLEGMDYQSANEEYTDDYIELQVFNSSNLPD